MQGLRPTVKRASHLVTEGNALAHAGGLTPLSFREVFQLNEDGMAVALLTQAQVFG